MKKAFILFALLGLATSTFAATSAKNNPNKAETEASISAKRSLSEVAEMMGVEEAEIEHFFGMEETVEYVKIYNADDELVAEGTVDLVGATDDAALAQALDSASRVMTIGDTHIYRTF